MNKRWARIFLAVMTVVCLWGAWMTPFHLALPKVSDYQINIELYDYSPYEKTGTLDNTPQGAALMDLLKETKVRLMLPKHTWGGVSGPEDFYYYISANTLNTPTRTPAHLIVFLHQNGRGEGYFRYWQTDHYADVYFSIPDTAPLIDFLENDVVLE